MINNKFIVLFALSACLQSYAMEVEVGASSATTPTVDHLVTSVMIQVRPEYVCGTRVVKTVEGAHLKKHEAKLTRLANECKAKYLQPIPDLGLYVISFTEPVFLSVVKELGKEMPGFENVHALADEDAKNYETKRLISEDRLKQFEAQRERTKNNTAKLSLLRKMSTSQMITLPKEFEEGMSTE